MPGGHGQPRYDRTHRAEADRAVRSAWLLASLRMEGGDSRRDDDAAGDNGTPTRSVVEIPGATPWLWRMVDRPGVLDVLAHSQHDKSAAQRRPSKLPKQQCRVPHVMITDKLGGESVIQQEPTPGVER